MSCSDLKKKKKDDNKMYFFPKQSKGCQAYNLPKARKSVTVSVSAEKCFPLKESNELHH